MSFIPFDVIQQQALAAQSELDRSAEMAQPEDVGIDQVLQEAAMFMSELSNPGHLNRIAQGVAAGMLESPFAENRQIGASMAASLGADSKAIQDKLSVAGRLEALQIASIDRRIKQLELKDAPDKIERDKRQAQAQLEATQAGIDITKVRTEGERISNLIGQSNLWTAEEKRQYLPESLQMEARSDRAKARISEAEAALREAELAHSPDVWRMQQELHKARLDELQAQIDANQAHGRYYNAAAAKEGAEISRLQKQLPDDVFKIIKSDYEYSSNQMNQLVQSQSKLLSDKMKLLKDMDLIRVDKSLSEGAKVRALASRQSEVDRIETTMRATEAMKVQVWNNRENARNRILAPYFGGGEYSSYGTNKYGKGTSRPPAFPEGGVYQPPQGMPAYLDPRLDQMNQALPGSVAADDNPLGLPEG